MTTKITQKQMQKQKSRQAILKSASKLFRKNGYSTTGIDAIVTEAGLTAGAFYAHFNSKQSLLQEIILKNINENTDVVGSEKISAFLDLYLSSKHRDHAQEGCVIAALGTEAQRLPKVVRKTLMAKVKAMSGRIAGKSQPSEVDLFLASTAIGCLLISRLMDDKIESDRFLAVAKKKLKAMSSEIINKTP